MPTKSFWYDSAYMWRKIHLTGAHVGARIANCSASSQLQLWCVQRLLAVLSQKRSGEVTPEGPGESR